MIWFTLEGNFEQIKQGRFILVFYDSKPHFHVVSIVAGRGKKGHPDVGTDYKIDPDTMEAIPVRSELSAWSSSVAVCETIEDVERCYDQVMNFSDKFAHDIEQARLRMLASIRLLCDQ